MVNISLVDNEANGSICAAWHSPCLGIVGLYRAEKSMCSVLVTILNYKAAHFYRNLAR
jgi:hypothetical protein